jgi:hypothetical protein
MYRSESARDPTVVAVVAGLVVDVVGGTVVDGGDFARTLDPVEVSVVVVDRCVVGVVALGRGAR